MKAVYGPVSSWRLGRSLGVDPISCDNKMCSFDCVYCQLGRARTVCERREFVSLEKLRKDLESIIKVQADVITFSGTGEPTLVKNLGEMVDYIRAVSDLPIAILTNSSLLSEEEVRNTLQKIDIVVAKLDASNEELFRYINRPHEKIKFQDCLVGIKRFRENFTGMFSLQIMFIDMNKGYAKEIAELAKELEPDEVQINTPLRPCAVKPLSRIEIDKIKEYFSHFKISSVYEATRPEVHPLDLGEVRKRKRPYP